MAKTRLYHGSNMERQYQLQSFGIFTGNFLVNAMGKIMSENQMGWCNVYLRNVTSTIDEQASHKNGPTYVVTDDIRRTDVLLGRGPTLLKYTGNIRDRKFVMGIWKNTRVRHTEKGLMLVSSTPKSSFHPDFAFYGKLMILICGLCVTLTKPWVKSPNSFAPVART